mmetsp:Transcript_40898/g.122207  ORF Transcript_40898/g.122207 Transcript_40898/m.122207 type:complete len:251 (+) Transcript_40898:176-928(+)
MRPPRRAGRPAPASSALVDPGSLGLIALELLHEHLNKVVVVGEGMQGRPQGRHGDRGRLLHGTLAGGGQAKLIVEGVHLRVVCGRRRGWLWCRCRRSGNRLDLRWRRHGLRLGLIGRSADLLQGPLKCGLDLLALCVVVKPQATDALGEVLDLVEDVVLLAVQLPVRVEAVEEVTHVQLVLHEKLVPRGSATPHYVHRPFDVCLAPTWVGPVLLQQVGDHELGVRDDLDDVLVLLLERLQHALEPGLLDP